MSDNGVVESSSISRFLYSHFPQDESALVRELFSVMANLASKAGSPDAALAIIAEITRTTGWATGPPNPTDVEIRSYVLQTEGVLEGRGLSDLDPEKHFAAILLSGKLLSITQEKGG